MRVEKVEMVLKCHTVHFLLPGCASHFYDHIMYFSDVSPNTKHGFSTLWVPYLIFSILIPECSLEIWACPQRYMEKALAIFYL